MYSMHMLYELQCISCLLFAEFSNSFQAMAMELIVHGSMLICCVQKEKEKEEEKEKKIKIL